MSYRRAVRLGLWPLFLRNAAGCCKTQDTEITGAGESLFTLTGRVSDIDNNRPGRDAVVEIKALPLKSSEDSHGVYSFYGLNVGTRTLQVSAANYATATCNSSKFRSRTSASLPAASTRPS